MNKQAYQYQGPSSEALALYTLLQLHALAPHPDDARRLRAIAARLIAGDY